MQAIWFINLQGKPQDDRGEDRLQIEREAPEEEDTTPAVQLDHQPQVLEEGSPQGPRKSSRQRKRPERLGTAASEEQLKQLSPRQRRRRQSQAKFGLTKMLAGQQKMG